MKTYIILPLLFLFLCCESTKLSEIRYTHSTTNIRMEKSTSSTIVKTLKSNQVVQVIPSKNDWWLVVGLEYNNTSKKKKIGYIHRSLLHQNPIKEKVTSEIDPQLNKQVSMVLDVEKLIGLDIKQMKNILGTSFSEFIPTSEQKRLMPEITPSIEWYFDEIGIYLEYRNYEKIMYIFVMNGGNYGVKYSTNDLMKMANLKSNSTRYTIEPQEVIGHLAGSGITGIHVYGKN